MLRRRKSLSSTMTCFLKTRPIASKLVRPLLSLGNLFLDLSYQGLTYHMADNFCLNIIRFALDFDFSAVRHYDQIVLLVIAERPMPEKIALAFR